jgi:hypothetical protein
VRAVLSYGAASAVILAVLALGVSGWVDRAEPSAVWLAAGLAWPVQMAAFFALVRGRNGPGFMVGWAGGMALRFMTVGAAALLVTRTELFDPVTALVSLVGFVFVLVLMEPLFLRLAD